MIESLKELAIRINKDIHGHLFIVGGAVRDMLLQQIPKDYDLELFHVEPKLFENWLTANDFKYKLNSNSKFPVIRLILDNNELEIGFPRIENKTGSKHSDYEVDVYPNMSVNEASNRRDFTINAMYYDIILEEYRNLHYICDLKYKKLKVVNVKTFREDALRIFRAMQFIARFELDFDDVVLAINQEMINELNQLDPSSIWLEFQKMIEKGTKKGVNMAIKFLLKLSSKFDLFPIFSQMAETKQNPEHHAEGDVMKHTILVVNETLQNSDLEKLSLYFLTALCHDMGKVRATFKKDDKIVAYGHEKMTDEAEEFLTAIGTPIKLKKQIIFLIHNHMLNEKMRDSKWMKKADEFDKVGLNLHDFMIIKSCDKLGAMNLKTRTEKIVEIIDFKNKFASLNILYKPLEKLINGNDIIKLANNKISGIMVGKLLQEVRESQYNGRIQDKKTACDFISRRLNKMRLKND